MSEPHFDVVGVGNAVLDIIAGVNDGFLESKGFSKGTMTLIDLEEAKNLYGAVSIKNQGPGGSVANTMCCLSLLGGKAAFIGKVRDDDLGQAFIDSIRTLGVTFDTYPAVNGPATAQCLVLVTPDAERTMQTYLGACAELDANDVDEDIISAVRIIFLEGYLWDSPTARQALIKAASLAQKHLRQVAFSLSDYLLVDRHRKDISEFIHTYTDILFANEEEILSLYQLENFDDAIKVISSESFAAAITRGANGSVVIRGTDISTVKAHSVAVVDTTGAGDAYAGGFFYGYTRGNKLGECGVTGAIAAADVIGQFGAHPTISLSQKIKIL